MGEERDLRPFTQNDTLQHPAPSLIREQRAGIVSVQIDLHAGLLWEHLGGAVVRFCSTDSESHLKVDWIPHAQSGDSRREAPPRPPQVQLRGNPPPTGNVR